MSRLLFIIFCLDEVGATWGVWWTVIDRSFFGCHVIIISYWSALRNCVSLTWGLSTGCTLWFNSGFWCFQMERQPIMRWELVFIWNLKRLNGTKLTLVSFPVSGSQSTYYGVANPGYAPAAQGAPGMIWYTSVPTLDPFMFFFFLKLFDLIVISALFRSADMCADEWRHLHTLEFTAPVDWSVDIVVWFDGCNNLSGTD